MVMCYNLASEIRISRYANEFRHVSGCHAIFLRLTFAPAQTRLNVGCANIFNRARRTTLQISCVFVIDASSRIGLVCYYC